MDEPKVRVLDINIQEEKKVEELWLLAEGHVNLAQVRHIVNTTGFELPCDHSFATPGRGFCGRVTLNAAE